VFSYAEAGCRTSATDERQRGREAPGGEDRTQLPGPEPRRRLSEAGDKSTLIRSEELQSCRRQVRVGGIQLKDPVEGLSFLFAPTRAPAARPRIQKRVALKELFGDSTPREKKLCRSSPMSWREKGATLVESKKNPVPHLRPVGPPNYDLDVIYGPSKTGQASPKPGSPSSSPASLVQPTY
jgi:hypothetical protein